MKKILVFSLTLALFLGIFVSGTSAQLLNDTSGLSSMTNSVAQTANFNNTSISVIIASTIKIILSFLATVFIILMIVAGFRWMNSQGNEEQITQAKDTIRTAIIGLIIVLAAYAITYFIFDVLPFTGGTAPSAAV